MNFWGSSPDLENAVPTICFQAPKSLRRAITARPRSPEAPVTTTVDALDIATVNCHSKKPNCTLKTRYFVESD